MTYSSPTPSDSSPVPNDASNGSDGTPYDGETVDVRSRSLDAEVRAVPLADLKCQLYAAVGPTNRGLAASPAAREHVLALISELERARPPNAPADDPQLLTGKWRLLFTNALDVLSLGLLAPVAQVGQIFQNIYETIPDERKGYEYDIENVVQLEPAVAPVTNAFFGQTMASVRVSAEGRRESESRIDIKFMQTAIRPETFAGFAIPQELPAARFGLGSPIGYIETTFLDSDIRIARAPPVGRKEGNVFVLMREQ